MDNNIEVEIREVKDEIKRVEEKIEEVEETIKIVEKKIVEEVGEGRGEESLREQQLRDEKKQLRDEKKQLREKERQLREQLREKEGQMREKEEQLRQVEDPRLKKQKIETTTAFFEKLNQAEVKVINGEMKVLQVGMCPPWLSIYGDPIFIRGVYEQLHEKICRSQFTRFAIVGNPGIGKSYFALYQLFLAVKGRKRVVLYHQTTDTSYVFVPSEGNCNCWDETGVTKAECDLYLYDCGTKEVPILPRARHIIMFCSPDEKNYRQFVKEYGHLLYMPVWTPDEMSAFAQYVSSLNLDSSNLRVDGYQDRLDKFGCIPRYVFGPGGDHETRLDNVCEKCTAIDLFQWGTNLRLSENTSHMVLHLIPDETFTKILTIDFASPYVERKVVNAMEKCTYQDTLMFLNRAKAFKELATLRGILFELFAHKELRKGGQFTVKCLKTSTISELDLPKRENIEFHCPSDITWGRRDAYWTPDYKTFASVDAICPPNFLFQMTVSSTHHIQASGIEKIATAAAAAAQTNEPFAFYFVVPSDVFDKFTSLQSIYRGNKVERNFGIEIEQHVLCINNPQINQ